MNNHKTQSYEIQIQRIDAILLKHWDPAGVSDVAAAQDEYLQYAAKIADLLRRNATEVTIARELNRIEAEMLGLSPDTARAERVARLLVVLPKAER